MRAGLRFGSPMDFSMFFLCAARLDAHKSLHRLFFDVCVSGFEGMVRCEFGKVSLLMIPFLEL